MIWLLFELQAEKLAHSEILMKNLWMENARLMAALNATEQRVVQLENLLKFQMTTSAKSSSPHHHLNNHQHHHQNNFHHNNQHRAYSSPSSPHGSPNQHNHLYTNNNNNTNNNNAILTAPLSLPHQSSHFNI